MESRPPFFLLAFANDLEGRRYLRKLPFELSQITEALDQAKSAGLCDYKTLPNATLKQILDTFQNAEYRHRITVFHYGGHANSLQLLLENNDGSTAVADARGLAAFLSQQRGLKLVFLNGCSTQPQVDALLDANISSVIATSQAIDDGVATDFASRFYRGLASGANIQSAYEEAAAEARTVSGGTTRNLYAIGARSNALGEERWPWELRFKKGAETEGQWNLPAAVGDPLFPVPGIPERDLPNEPFRHLTWFTREHAEIFFGRNNEIRQLYDRLTERNGSPIVLLYGQAGVGKSSLLDAGLIPRLEVDHEVLYLRRNQDLGLLQTAVQGLKHKDSLSSAWLAREQQASKPLILVLDQVEEIFTRPTNALADELHAFLSELAETLAVPQSRPRGRLILGFRKEWEPEIEQKLQEHKLPHAKVFLDALDRQGIIQAITGITKGPRLQRKYGLTVEKGLPEIIADRLASDPDSPVAPTLQILLTKMWAEAKKLSNSGPVFNENLYQQLRKEGILLGDFLDQQLAKLKDGQSDAVTSGLALDLLAFHTTPLGTAAQRVDAEIKTEYSHQAPVLSPLIEKLKELYLISDPPDDQLDQAILKATRLAHDTIAPIVRARFDKSVLPGQRARRVLENRSPDWQGDNVGVPLDERDLSTVEKGVTGMRTWTSDERRLVEASRSLRARRQRTKSIVTVAAIAGLIVIVVASAYAWWQRGKAREAEVKAVARQLAAQADSLAGGPADLLMRRVLLAVEANRLDVSGESINALHSSLALMPFRKARFKHDGAVRVTQFSPDGKLLGTGSEDKTARLWNLADGKELARVTHKYPITSAVFSNDGRYFISGSGEGKEKEPRFGQVKVWDTQTRTELTIAEELNVPVVKLAFIPETYSVVIQTIAAVQVVSLVNSQPTITSELTANLWRGVLSPDARYVAYQDNLVIHVADITNESPEVTFVITPNSGNRYSRTEMDAMTNDRRASVEKGMRENQVDLMAFSNDGRYLAIATPDELFHVWDWSNRKEVQRRRDPFSGRIFKGTPFTVAFSGDNRYIGYINRNQKASVWDAATGQDIWNQQFNDENVFADIRFLDSAKLLIISNRSVRLFNLPSAENNSGRSGREELRIVPEDSILGAALSPNEEQLAVADRSGSASVWDLRTIRHEKIFDGGLSVWYSPSGRYRLEYGFGGLRIFDSATDKLLGDCSLNPMQAVTTLSDEFVAVSGSDGRVRVCELATGSVIREFKMDSAPSDLVMSSDRSVLLAITTSNHPKVLNWDDGSQKDLSNIDVERHSRFSRDGRYVVTTRIHSDSASGSGRSSFEVFEVRTGRRTANIDYADTSYGFPFFSPTGEHVAAMGRRPDSTEVSVWESHTGRLMKGLASTPEVNPRFSDDGKYLVVPDGPSVRILNLQTLEINLIQTLIPARRAVLSPDSKFLLVVSNDRMLQVWNVADKRLYLSQQLEMGQVYDIDMSPDGKYLIVTGNLIPYEPQRQSTESKPQIHFLVWQSKDLIQQACARATRNLWDYEWKDYRGNEPYRKTCPDIDEN
ncbi:MAG TPA: AAA family ATPase [Pyrinomonadaceae bacterium]|nr:AAA family ATPase [Pyrinomonadaceae bacterium]